MKKLTLFAVLLACVLAVGIGTAQYTNPSNPNYGTNKPGQCYNSTLNNWVNIANTTANLNAYPITCDQQGNLTIPTGTFLPLSGGTLTGSLTDASGFIGPLTGAVTGNVTGNLTGTVTGGASLDLPLAGGALTGAVTTSSTINGMQLLTGATGTISGTSLSATCDSGTATVTGAVVGHPVAVSSTTGADVGGAFYLRGSVTTTGTVTVYVCGTGTPSSLAYNVAVF